MIFFSKVETNKSYVKPSDKKRISKITKSYKKAITTTYDQINFDLKKQSSILIGTNPDDEESIDETEI